MKTNLRKTTIVAAIAFISGTGCGRTHFEKPTIKTNEPPPRTLSEYDRIELLPMTYAPSVLSQEKKTLVKKISGKMDALLRQQLQGIIATWNADHEGVHIRGALKIQPVITQLKYVTRGQRIWAKSMYGNSGIVVEVQIVDDTGVPIHKALFFGSADAAYGSMTKGWGEQEVYMLKSVSERIATYLVKNYKAPYGGSVYY